MKALTINIGEFESEIYIQALVTLARADGMEPDEELFIRHQASSLGLDPEPYLTAPETTLEQLGVTASATTRRLIYRDCVMLAQIDGHISEAERGWLDRLGQDLALDAPVATKLESWALRYIGILDEGEALLAGN